MNAKLKAYLLHYTEGLLASSWNGGIAAVTAGFGSAGAALVTSVQPMNKQHMFSMKDHLLYLSILWRNAARRISHWVIS